MYRNKDAEPVPAEYRLGLPPPRSVVAYQPAATTADVRRVLLMAVAPEVQEVFHRLEAARTPDEWVEREASLRTLIGAQAISIGESSVPKPAYEVPGDWPFQFVKSTCPACHAAMPLPSPAPAKESDHPLLRHLEGVGGVAPCPVIGELLEYFNSQVRPNKFSAEAVANARARYDELVQQPRAQTNRPKLTRRDGRNRSGKAVRAKDSA